MKMIGAERRAAGALAGIYALRMLGLFLVLPVLALAARDLSGATPALIGLAVGIYGLTQAALQIPFGLASDRFGRKRVIAFGLAVFALGSVVAALSDSMVWLIAGRALQGAGAIAAALMALAADLTRDEVRSRTMAIIGVAIGASFSLALMLGPVLYAGLDLAALFWLAAILAGVALVLLYTLVPTPKAASAAGGGPGRKDLRAVLVSRPLLQLDGGIFALHLIMTGTFVAVPLALADAGFGETRQWQLYLPVFAGSVALMGPLIMLGERLRRTRLVFRGSIALVVLGQGALGLASGWPVLAAGLLIFFTGFNLLEATLPALISRTAPAAQKGAAMGAYSAAQFLGAFAGGLLAGVLNGVGGPPLVFAGLAVAAAIWLLAAWPMPVPDAAVSYVVSLAKARDGSHDPARDLSDLPGVEEAVVVEEEGVAYLRVDERRFRKADLERAGYDTADSGTTDSGTPAGCVR